MNAQEPTANKPTIGVDMGEPGGDKTVVATINRASGKVEKIEILPNPNAPRIMEAPVKCQRCDKPLNTHNGWPDWCPTKPHGQNGSAKYGDE